MLRRSAPQIASQLMQGQETGPVAAPAKDWLHSCQTTGDKAIRGQGDKRDKETEGIKSIAETVRTHEIHVKSGLISSVPLLLSCLSIWIDANNASQ